MSQVENTSAKVLIETNGYIGTKFLTPVVANKLVTSTAMKLGTYTIAAQPIAPSILSVGNTVVATADTMGTIDFVGTDITGATISESVVPVANSTVLTTKEFASVTSITGTGWVIGGATADNIVVGTAGQTAGTGSYFCDVQITSATVVASQTNKTGAITANLALITSIPVGVYPTKVTYIALTSGQGIGYLAKG